MMNFSKFQFFVVYSSANLRQTVSAIDMVVGALYNLGLGLLKTIVDDMRGALKFCVDVITSKGTCFLNLMCKNSFLLVFDFVFPKFFYVTHTIDYSFQKT